MGYVIYTQHTFYFTNNQFYLFAEVQLHDFILAKLTARSLSPRNNACFVNTLILDSNQIKFICTINEHQKTITIDADGRKMRTNPSFSLLYSLSLRSLGCSVARSFDHFPFNSFSFRNLVILKLMRAIFCQNW